MCGRYRLLGPHIPDLACVYSLTAHARTWQIGTFVFLAAHNEFKNQCLSTVNIVLLKLILNRELVGKSAPCPSLVKIVCEL